MIHTTLTTCPKCGYASTSDQACDACGVIFSKLRQREAGQDLEPEQSIDLQFHSPASSFSLHRSVKLFILVAIVAGVAAWFFAPRNSNDAFVTELNDGNFSEEVTSSLGLYVVDFWASWCPPCRQFSPILAEYARENAGKVHVGKVNVDANPTTARQFGIRAIPTVLVFKDGKLAATLPAMEKNALQQSVDSYR